MAEFTKLRQQVQEARRAFIQAEKLRYDLQEEIKLLQQAITAEQRRIGVEELPQQHELMLALKPTEKKMEKAVNGVEVARTTLGSLQKTVAATPIAEQMTVLKGELPILMLPLRIQTRFMQIQHVAKDLDQDLLYDIKTINPDDYRSFIPWSTDNLQIPRGGREFIPMVRNSGNPVLHAYDDVYELWVRIFPDDIFVHHLEENLTPGEHRAAISYWTAIFKADKAYLAGIKKGTKNKRQLQEEQEKAKLTAWTRLHHRYGQTRAAWIAKAMMPTNHNWKSGVELNEKPKYPKVAMRSANWTKAPRTYLLPERFTVRLYKGRTYEEFSGEPINFPLYLGIGPDSAITEHNGSLQLSEDKTWLNDFEAAERVGMAIKIPIPGGINATYEGFDKMIVVGVKTSADEQESKQLLEELLQNHQFRPRGTSLMPIGTPTNNLEGRPAFSDHRKTGATSGYQLEMASALFKKTTDPIKKSDGQRLADALGLDPIVFGHVQFSDGMEGSQALAMNRMLWPATLGYYLTNFFTPAIQRLGLEQVYDFFTHYVTARGLLSTIRIGQQPYGVLPTTAYSKWRPQDEAEASIHLVLKTLESSWDSLLANGKVKNITDYDDEETFSDFFVELLRMSPNSQRYYGRGVLGAQADGGADYNLSDIYEMPEQYEVSYGKTKPDFLPLFRMMQNLSTKWENIHSAMGYRWQMFHKFLLTPIFHAGFSRAEILQIKSSIYPDAVGDLNYLDWLSRQDYPALKAAGHTGQDGFPMLYGFAKYALHKAYIDAGLSQLQTAGLLSPYDHLDFEIALNPRPGTSENRTALERMEDDLVYRYLHESDAFNAALTRELRRYYQDRGSGASFNAVKFHIQGALAGLIGEGRSEVARVANNWPAKPYHQYLEEAYGDLTNGLALHEFVDQSLSKKDDHAIRVLARAKAATRQLGKLDLKAQQQLLAEHVDLCSYRLDAWKQGLVMQRLAQHRSKKSGKTGLYLGAYGYLENIRYKKEDTIGKAVRYITPRTWIPQEGGMPMYNTIVPVVDLKAFVLTSKKNQRESFIYLGHSTPPVWDPQLKVARPQIQIDTGKDGFLHAPSLGHASTAAILRSGYLSQRQDDSPTSSPLAVHLDSQRVRRAMQYLEGLQNGQSLSALLGYQLERSMHEQQLDAFILNLRYYYPLEETAGDESQNSGEGIRPLNVVDGLSLIQDFRKTGLNTFRLKKAISAQTSGSDLQQVLEQMEDILKASDDTLDAISDLLVAESTYQWANGNPARARAALRTLDDGAGIQLPQIAEQPLTGTSLTHRVGVLLSIAPSEKKDNWDMTPSPAAMLSPHLNHWLKQQLPDPDLIHIHANVSGKKIAYPLSIFPLQPIDLLYLIRNGVSGEENELVWWLTEQLREREWTHKVAIHLDLTSREKLQKSHFTLYELMPLLNSLQRILSNCRTIRPGDFDPDKRGQADNTVVTKAWEDRIALLLDSSTGALPNMVNRLQKALNKLQESGNAGGKAQQAYTNLYECVRHCSRWRIPQAYLVLAPSVNDQDLETLEYTAKQVLKVLDTRLDNAEVLWGKLQKKKDPDQRIDQLEELSRVLFNDQVKVLPEFRQLHPAAWSYAFKQRNTLLPADSESVIEEWLQGLAVVRPELKNYQQLQRLREGFEAPQAGQQLQIAQLPMQVGKENAWLGVAFNEQTNRFGSYLSMALEIPKEYKPEAIQVGFVLDEWTEKIPEKEQMTGVSFNYDEPNNEAPQAVLLAVAPTPEEWTWDTLFATVDDTFDLVKKRAIDPDILMDDPFTQRVLPAIAPIITKEDFNLPMDILHIYQQASAAE